MKCLIVLPFLLIGGVLRGQIDYEDLHIKEHFDQIYTQNNAYQYWETNAMNFSNMHDNSGPIYGFHLSSEFAPAWEGLLTMYETTKDKAYLYEFIRDAYKVINLRRDIAIDPVYYPIWFRSVDFSGNPDPTGNRVSAVFNGRVTWPLAHFAYLVKSDNDLYNTPIKMIFPKDNGNPYGGHATFGSFADWVLDRVDETLQSSITYMWHSTPSCNGHEGIGHNFANQAYGAFNFQTPFAMTFLYMYLADNGAYYNYGVNAVKIAQLILDNNCNSHAPGPNTLQYNSANDSYYWMHEPWKNSVWYEDIGHATWDIHFPILYNRYKNRIYNHVTTGQYFEDYQLSRFRNTFSKNIYDPSYVTGGTSYSGYWNGVDGTNNNLYSMNYNPDPNLNYTFDDNKARMVGGSYMPLYIFDDYGTNSPPNVYNIILDAYRDHFINQHTFTWYNPDYPFMVGMNMKGFAETVAAQWAVECFSLELTQRDLYYDQDFMAKNTLVVAPKDDAGYLYDDISSAIGYKGLNDGTFRIREHISSEMTAGKKIVFRAGFKAERGAEFHAYINSDLYVCNETGRGNEHEEEEGPGLRKKAAEESNFGQPGLAIYPNPHNGSFDISCPGSGNALLHVYDITGQSVFSENRNFSARDHISLPAEIKPGIYVVTLLLNGSLYKEKMIIE